jgi:hypothetical protein
LGIASVAVPTVAQAAGSNLQAQDTAIQAGSVSITTDAVASSTPLTGLRQWQFSLGNSGTSPASGATIAVHTLNTGPALNNAAQFGFSAQLNPPFLGPPTTPTPVTCTTPTATDESCGPASVAASGGQLMVSTGSARPGQPVPGVPTNFTPGFDSARNGTIGGQWMVPATLSQAAFPQNGDIMVSLRGNFQQTAGAQITTGNVPVPACTPGVFNPTACSESQFQPGGQGSCNGAGAWFLAVHNAQSATTYTFATRQDPCASGKPVVDITAGSFSPPTSPTTADSVAIPDPNLGTITFTVSAAAAGSPANSFNTATNNQVQLEYQGVAPACPPNCGGPGANLQAQDTNILSGPPQNLDAVPATQSITGVRQWQFMLQNFGNSQVTGATIAIHSNGPALNNAAQFSFSANVFGPFSGPPTPPSPVTCQAPTATDETCGPASTPLTGGGGNLQVLTGAAPPGQPSPGVPTTFTTGFDSSRTGTVGGAWTVPVSLTQARFPQGGDIMVNLRGNFVQGSGAQVTSASGPVPACAPGVFNPTACSESQFQPGGQGSCNGAGAWFLAVHNGQSATTYTFAAQQDPCATGKPIVDITAGTFSPPGAPTTANTVTIPDPNLGTTGAIAYTVDAATGANAPNSFNTTTNEQVRLEYQGVAPACPPNCGGPGASLQAQDTSIQGASVGTAVDAVTGGTSLNGARQWQLSVANFGSNPVNGATISVHSNGPALNNAAEFGFSARVFGPFGQPGQPTPVPCAAPTASDETCGPAGSPLVSGGGRLAVFTGSPGQLSPGVPTTFTLGFDSQRNHGANGLWSVPVTLTDASRFSQGADIFVSLGGNFLSAGSQVTMNGTALAQCTPGPPSSTACAFPAGFQPGGATDCGGTSFLGIQRAQPNTTYVFSAQQGACATGKPVVDIAVSSGFAPNCCTTADTAVITDPNLGTITFSANPSNPPNSFGTGTNSLIHIRYLGTTSTTVSSSANPSQFGQSVAFSAAVSPVPDGGTVQFSIDGSLVGSPAPIDRATGSASGPVIASLLPETHTIGATYTGDTNFSPSTGSIVQTVSCSNAVTASVNGDLTVSNGTSTCTSGTPITVSGNITVQAGGALFLSGATVHGGITADGAAELVLCRNQVDGAVSVMNGAGFVLLGDGGEDGCPANSLHGIVTVAQNRAGFEVSGNSITGSMTVNANTVNAGARTEDGGLAGNVVEGNAITGSLGCTGDTPAATAEGIANTASGGGSGECLVSNPPPPPGPRPRSLPSTGGLTPARILDTRDGTGGVPAAALGPGSALDVQIAGRGGVPAAGISAVILNVTVTGGTAPGYLVVYQKGIARPRASNLNWVAGQTVANLVEVPLSADGKVTVFNSQGSSNVIFDVTGFVAMPDQSPGPDGLYNPLVPARLLDTRTGTGGATRVAPGGTVSLQVTGRGNVPATGVSAVVLNVTATNPSGSSYVTVWPDGAPRPLASSLNFVAGQTVPNRVIVAVGAGGKVDLYNFAGNVDLVVDVGGYFTDATAGGTGSRFNALTSARLLDTRDGTGGVSSAVGAGGMLAVQVAGQKGVPAMTAAIPPTAVVLNVTVTNPTAAGYLTVWPDGNGQPLASDLNFGKGQTRANLVVVKVGANGKVDLFSLAGSTDVVIDVVGWYG